MHIFHSQGIPSNFSFHRVVGAVVKFRASKFVKTNPLKTGHLLLNLEKTEGAAYMSKNLFSPHKTGIFPMKTNPKPSIFDRDRFWVPKSLGL